MRLADAAGDDTLPRQLRQAAARLSETAALLERTPLVRQAQGAARMRDIADRLPWLAALSAGALEDATAVHRTAA